MQPNTRSCLLATLLVVNVALAQIERMPLSVLIREPINLLPVQPQMEPITTTTTTTTTAPTTTSTTTVPPTRILQPIQQHPTIQQVFVAPPSTTTSTTTTTELPISSSSTTSSTTTTTTTTTTVPPTRILQPIQQHPTIQQIFVAPPSTTTSTTTTTELPSSSSSTTSSTTTSTTAAVSSSAIPSSTNPSTTSTSSISPSSTSTSITSEWLPNDSPVVSLMSTSTPSAPSSTSSAPSPPPPTTTILVEKNIPKQDDFNEVITPCLKGSPPVDINETEPRESLPWTEQFQSHLNAPLQRYSLHLLIALSIMTTLFTVTLYLYLRKPKSFMPSTQGGAYDNPRFAKFSTYYVDHSHVRLVDENNQNFHNDAIIEQLNQSSKHKNQEADKTSPLQQQHSHYQMDAVYHQNNRLI